MIMNKMKSMSSVRTLKDANFSDVYVDIDNYCGEKRDPVLIGKDTIKNKFLLWLDNFLLNKRGVKHEHVR